MGHAIPGIENGSRGTTNVERKEETGECPVRRYSRQSRGYGSRATIGSRKTSEYALDTRFIGRKNLKTPLSLFLSGSLEKCVRKFTRVGLTNFAHYRNLHDFTIRSFARNDGIISA